MLIHGCNFAGPSDPQQQATPQDSKAFAKPPKIASAGRRHSLGPSEVQSTWARTVVPLLPGFPLKADLSAQSRMVVTGYT